MNSRRLARMNELLFLAGLLTVIGLFSSGTISTVYVKETVFRHFALLALATALPLLGGEAWRVAARLGVPVFLLWAWLFLSFIMARHRPAAAAFLGHQILFTSLGLFVAVRSRDRGFSSRLLSILAFIVALASLYALLQWFHIDFFAWGDFAWGPDTRRISSSFGNPNFFAGFLVATVPLLFALALAAGHLRRRSALVLIAVLATLCGVLTFSRAGIAALAAGLLALAAFLLGMRSLREFQLRAAFRGRRHAAVIAALLILVALVAMVLPPRAVLTRITGVDLSASSRALVYLGTSRMIAAQPLFGVGGDSFGAVFPYYRPVELSRLQPPSVLVFDRAHSEYLQVAAELGFPGLFLFLWLILLPLAAGGRALLRPGNHPPTRRLVIAGLLASYLGVLLQNLVSVNLRRTSTLLIYWILWGLLIGLSAAASQERTFRGRWLRLPRPHPAVFALTLLLVFPALVLNLEWYMGDCFAQSGRIAREGRSREATLHSFRRALDLNPFRADINYYAGSGFYTLALADPAGSRDLLEQALDAYRRVEALGGPFADVHLNQATCLLQLGRVDEAVAVYARAIRLDPYHAKLRDYVCRAYLAKAHVLADQGRNEESQAARQAAREAWLKAREYYGPSVDADARNPDLRLAYARFLNNLSREFIDEPATLKRDLGVAFEEVREAVRLDPGHPGAQALYRQLLPYAPKEAPVPSGTAEESTHVP